MSVISLDVCRQLRREVRVVHLDVRGQRVVQVGHSRREVARVRRGVRRGSPAVLQQDVPVVSAVEVGPPHQHLGKSKRCSGALPRKSKAWNVFMCSSKTRTWASVPPEANRSPALEKATVITGP